MAEFCSTEVADPFRCPTKWDLWRQTLANMPSGRAWQNYEDEVERSPDGLPGQVGTFETIETPLGYEVNVEFLTTMQQFWAAFAEELEHVNQRACALLEEFFCSSTTEMIDEWMIDYGFPDVCEPWNTLCEKVAAQGGATCAYLVGLAAARGWVITCEECDTNTLDAGSTMAGTMQAGCSAPCGCPPGTIWITVHMAESPSYIAPPLARFDAGALMAGLPAAGQCPPPVEPLRCLIERFKPAHVRAVYFYDEGPQP